MHIKINCVKNNCAAVQRVFRQMIGSQQVKPQQNTAVYKCQCRLELRHLHVFLSLSVFLCTCDGKVICSEGSEPSMADLFITELPHRLSVNMYALQPLLTSSCTSHYV